ncbi:MAG: SPOR domain-containing protein [Luminiphilus sp.]|nr:SPOR domain-containing protein [Luminiphilus sp.]
MNPLLKQRLVGASVLVALGVVFWPLIFSQPDIREPLVLEQMPARPIINQAPIPAPTNPSEKIAAQLPAITQVSAERQAAADTMTRYDADAQALANLVSNDEPVEVPVRSIAANETLIDEAGLPIFWVLQVATVGREARAAEIVEALQEAGYKAFYSQYIQVDRELYRVQVGPSSDPRYLRDVKLKVDIALNVDAQLLRYMQ